MDWNNITLYQFQEIDRINASPKMDDLDKLLWTTCVVFGLTEYQLDSMAPKKAARLMKKVEAIFSSNFRQLPKQGIGKYRIEYDVSKLRLGQYVELSHFLQGNTIANCHLVLASISHMHYYKTMQLNTD